jgi:hypothetical protein
MHSRSIMACLRILTNPATPFNYGPRWSLTLFYARPVRALLLLALLLLALLLLALLLLVSLLLVSLLLVSPTRAFPPRSDGQLLGAGKARVNWIAKQRGNRLTKLTTRQQTEALPAE